jgi:hypothetical protein
MHSAELLVRFVRLYRHIPYVEAVQTEYVPTNLPKHAWLGQKIKHLKGNPKA